MEKYRQENEKSRDHCLAFMSFMANEYTIFMMNAPSFRCLPDLVKGMPIFREIFALRAEIPISRFHENPPRFINLFLLLILL